MRIPLFLLTLDICHLIIYLLKDLFVLYALVGIGDEKVENSPDKHPAWGERP